VYWLLNLLGIVKIAFLRQKSYLGLVLALLAGFIVAITLVVSIPLYADAVGYRILRTELLEEQEGNLRPPFSYMFMAVASNEQRVPLSGFRSADEYFTKYGARDLGLPPLVYVRYVTTDKIRLLAPEGTAYKEEKGEEQLEWVSVGFASGLEKKVRIVEGRWPKIASNDSNSPVEVLVHEGLADKLGLHVGENYIVMEKGVGDNLLRLPIKISGIWEPIDPSDSYWFIRPQSLQDVLMVPEQTFSQRILRTHPNDGIYMALWYYVLDGTSVRSRHAQELIGRMQGVERHAATLLPTVELRVSPEDALTEQHTQVRFLTLSLIVFSIPILGLIAYFIIMITSMAVQRQQNEIAVLRSRGISRSGILGIFLLESLGLGILALVLGLGLGQYTALAMGWTRSFLDFIPRYDFPVELSPESIRAGTWVMVLTLIASVVPAVGAAGHTIISYKRERARSLGAPFWQKIYLDILLLIPAWYGYQQLKQRGTISFLGEGLPSDDPFKNPLLILTPVLWLLALGLLSMRILPIVLGFIAQLIGRLKGISSVMALRYLTRTPRAYSGPVMLIVLTLSLATFTASMAKTLDRHTYDRVYYDIGADMRLADLGQSTEPSSAGPGGGSSQQQPEQQDEGTPKWLFLPVTEYLKVPGVENAMRVTRSDTEAVVGNSRQRGTLLGIDRMEFPKIAYWRDDYATYPLGYLMNALGTFEDGLLVSRDFMREQGLSIGSKITLNLWDVEESKPVPFTIVGELNYFPTLYPEDGPFFVGNIDYIFQREGGEFPYEVWLKVKPGTTKEQIELSTTKLGFRSIVTDVAQPEIESDQGRPERQGLYGLLSVGFLASAILTGLGFLFYSIVSFRRRFVELGTLRAIGLSTGQMAAMLACEQLIIIGLSVVIGTVLGVLVSDMFIPFLQVSTGEHPQTPPFLVLIAWDRLMLIYLIFAVLLGLALVMLAMLLLRMKIFQAVKLGESV